MTADDLKAQMIRMDAFADGMKQGAKIIAEWMASEMAKQEKINVPMPDEVKTDAGN